MRKLRYKEGLIYGHGLSQANSIIRSSTPSPRALSPKLGFNIRPSQGQQRISDAFFLAAKDLEHETTA